MRRNNAPLIKTIPRAIPTRSPTLSESQPPGMVTSIIHNPNREVAQLICWIDRPPISCMYTGNRFPDNWKEISRKPSVIRIQVINPPENNIPAIAPRLDFRPPNESLFFTVSVLAASRDIPMRMIAATR